MHGVIFFLLEKYVEKKGDSHTWSGLFSSAGLKPQSYAPVGEKPDQEAVALLQALAGTSGQSLPAVLEEFGIFLVPELLAIYGTLVQPEWKTLDVIANTEEIMHEAVRKTLGARPPVLRCVRPSENELQLIYASARKLCPLAKGIIKGIARHFQEIVTITDQSCMLDGDPFCALSICTVPAVTEAEAPATWADSPASAISSPSNPAPGPSMEMLATLLSRPRRPDFLAPPQQSDELGRLGTYRILRLLGQGGMGLVYLAEDTQLLRQVALKVLKPDLAQEVQFQERFLREARAAAALQNDHIVPVYHIGQERGAWFLVMPFLQGETLHTWRLRSAPVTLGEVVRIGSEIAQGLDAAHDRGLVHRDIKPNNLWVEAPLGRIKIMDFGLAHPMTETSHLTEKGMLLGTLGFMSPEQAEGQAVDARSDLYSTGVVLYQLCANRLPLEKPAPMQMLRALALESPRPIREFSPLLPPALSNLIMELLAKDPSLRLPSAQAVLKRMAAIDRELTASAGNWKETVIAPAKTGGVGATVV